MEGYRKRGRKVILVGDLNIAHEAIDTHWNYRRIRVGEGEFSRYSQKIPSSVKRVHLVFT